MREEHWQRSPKWHKIQASQTQNKWFISLPKLSLLLHPKSSQAAQRQCFLLVHSVLVFLKFLWWAQVWCLSLLVELQTCGLYADTVQFANPVSFQHLLFLFQQYLHGDLFPAMSAMSVTLGRGDQWAEWGAPLQNWWWQLWLPPVRTLKGCARGSETTWLELLFSLLS